MMTARGMVMEKWLCLSALGVAGLLMLIFALDLFLGVPMGGGSVFMLIDIPGLLASGILAYLAFNAYRDLR